MSNPLKLWLSLLSLFKNIRLKECLVKKNLRQKILIKNFFGTDTFLGPKNFGHKKMGSILSIILGSSLGSLLVEYWVQYWAHFWVQYWIQYLVQYWDQYCVEYWVHYWVHY